jgi:transaldolase
VPINVTLLFAPEQYLAAADAYLQGVERRLAAGLDPAVGSVASVFMSRWDVAVAGQVPAELTDQLGLAVGRATYRAYRQMLSSDRVLRLENQGARVQRLLWASTGTKNPDAPDTLYVHGLAAPFTINTMPDKTLEAFYDHGEVGEPMPADGGDCDEALARFTNAGVDVKALATKLQADGADAFADSWKGLLDRISAQSSSVT